VPTYTVAGIALDADLPLPELAAGTGTERTRDWRVRGGALPSRPDLTAVHEVRYDSGEVWCELAAGDRAYRLAFPAHVVFDIDVAAGAVTYATVGDVADTTLRHLIVDQLVPHLVAIGGALVLHASCVALEGGALAVVGGTGRGKSSLAAAFVQRGAALVADDYVLLSEAGDGYLAAPAYPGLRLWEDSAAHFAGSTGGLTQVAEYTSKRRWEPPLGAAPEERFPLRALVVLGEEPEPGDGPVRIGPLRGSEAFVALYQQAFRLERAGREAHTAELDRFVALASRVPVLLLEHRRDYALLPEVTSAVLDAVDRV
jgi:hypothetical protein